MFKSFIIRYYKQKEEPVKGDWVELVRQDFKFINEEMNDDEIKKIPKNVYKERIKKKVKQAAFESYVKEKNLLSKIKDIEYTKLETQHYLTSPMFNKEERMLLFSLRSKCHGAKDNFKNMFLHIAASF